MKPKSTLRSFLLLAGSSLLAISYSQAATLYWDGTNASWNTNTNWSTASGADTPDPSSFPGILDDAIFNITTANGNESVTLDANQSARSLTFNNTGTTTLLGGVSSTLTLGTGGSTVDALAGAVTLGDGTAANDVLISLTNGTRTWTNNSASNFTINNSAASFSRVAGATLVFNKVGAGDFSMSTTVLPNTNDIVGPWALFGTGGTQRYAFNNAGTIADYTGGTAAADANAFASATTNYDLTSAAITLTGSRTANTFRSAGAGGIIDLGASGANTLTANGILAVGSGTLSINRTGGTGTVVIGASNELVIAGSQAVSIGAPISGTAKSLTYSGTSSLTLSAATFTGALSINSGTLNASFAPTYTSANLAAGATWNYLNAFGNNPSFNVPFTINGSFVKTGNGSMTFNSGATISGSGSLSFSGQVTIAINSNNPNFTGTIIEASQGGSGFNIGHNGALGAGLLVFGANTNVIQSTVGGGYVAAYASTYRFDASRTFGGSNNLDFGSGAVTLNANPTITVSNTTTFGGAIGQTGGTRTLGKAGAGTLVLGGSTSNTYGGLTSVTAGTLQLAKSGTANAIAGGGLSVGTGATVTYTGASTDMIANAAPVTVTGTGLLNLNGVSDTIGTLGLTAVAANNALVTTGAGTLTLGGNVTFTAATTGTAQISGNLDLGAATRTFTVGLGTGGRDLLVDAAISGTGVGLTKAGTGRLTLSSANTYDGLTTVSAGRLTVTNGAAIPSGGLTINANQSFVYAPTVAGALNLGSGVLTLGSGTTTSIGTALGGTASQSVTTSSSAASLAGTGVVNISLIPGAAPALGTNNLITAASGLDGGTYTLGTVYGNTDFTLSNFTRSATAISVDVTAATPLSGDVAWKGGLAGNTGVWSASNGSTQSNWQVTDGVNQPIAPGATTDLVFSTASTPGTMVGMSLGANMTIRSLTVNNSATAFGLNADGNTLTITPSSSTTGITFGASAQSSTINVPVILGAAQTWTNNNSAATLSMGAIINQNGNSLTFDGSGNFNFDNNAAGISGAGGIIKNGTGQLIFTTTAAPTYTFTGDITLNGGYIGFQNSSVLSGRNTKITGGYLGGRFNSGFTWTGGLGTGANQIQITGGTSGFSGEGGTGSAFQIGTALSTLVWGASGEGTATGFFNPTVLLANGPARSNTNGKGSLNNGINLNGATRTITSTQTTDNAASSGFTISGVISNSTGTSGLTKTGVGNLILAAANTFNGLTTISGGFLTLGNASALGNSVLDTTSSIAGSGTAGLRTTVTTLTLGGLSGNKDFDDTAGSVFTSAAGGYGSVTALTLNPAVGVTPSYSGAIGNGASGMTLTKSGAGTQTLSGTNSYTGATTVSAGTLLVNGSLDAASNVTVQTTGILGGTGTINGSVTVATAGSLLAPDASAGTLNIGGGLTVTAMATGITGKLNFELGPIAASDKLAVTGTLTIGTDVLGFSDFVFSPLVGLQNGTYKLITSGGISGTLDPVPANLTGAVGAGTGTLQITGNDLELVVTGLGGDVTPPTLTGITDNVGGGPVTEDAAVTYTVTFNEDMDAASVTTADFDNQGTATCTINSVVETAPTSGVFTVVATPTSPGTLRLRIPTGAVVEDTSGNDLVVPVSDDTTITVVSKYEAWSGAADFDADTNGDGVDNGLAFLLGAANKNVSALSLLPTVTQSGGDLILEFDMLNSANRKAASLNVQHSSDLGIGDAWESALVPNGDSTVNDVVFDITAGSPLNGVQATIPASKAAGNKLFGRLKGNP